MKRSVKYLTVAFLFLMGYSQIFTYVYLGVSATPTARIAEGAKHYTAPLTNASIFDNAMIEEIEENKDDRDPLNIHSRILDSVHALFMPFNLAKSFQVRASRFSPFEYSTLSGDSCIRFRVFRL
ncbi:MAG TPA: hypothetical protein PLR06_13250 [Cyclobacteriaceae bacterium]|nr:hypothetical protein [Cyclobacteriaceae bacterium]